MYEYLPNLKHLLPCYLPTTVDEETLDWLCEHNKWEVLFLLIEDTADAKLHNELQKLWDSDPDNSFLG